MPTQDLINSDDVPTLNNVIETGDEAVIQTKRISHQIGHELDSNLGPSLSREIIQALAMRDKDEDETQADSEWQDQPDEVTLSQAGSSPSSSAFGVEDEITDIDPDETLELMIDSVVDRHITNLRQDIRRLLERAIDKR